MTGDAFLDVVGTGTAPARRPHRPRPQHLGGTTQAGRSLEALVPVVAMLAALAAVASSGLNRRLSLPEALEPYAYGFFLDRYPLFAFALVYGAARIVAVAAGRGPGSVARRVVFSIVGIALLALAGLYPTFGGLILRGGFATGGMAFLTGQPLWLAYAAGAGVAASIFAAIVGASGLAANRSLRPKLRRVGAACLSYLCLWFGAGVIGLAHGAGFGPWPARAMLPGEAGLAAGLLLLAVAPHSLLVALRPRRSIA